MKMELSESGFRLHRWVFYCSFVNILADDAFITMMKKGLSIFSSFFILLAGMHLSFDVHHCHGSIASMKFSFTGALATCGMENGDAACSFHGMLSSDCCHDSLAQLITDRSYMPATAFVKEVKMQVLRIVEIPAFTFKSLAPSGRVAYTDTGPPGNSLISLVSLPVICIFRI